MNAPLKSPEATLAGVCIVLGIIFLYLCVSPLPSFSPSPAHLKWHNITIQTASFVPPPDATFSTIDQRPLFNPSRKPMEVKPVSGMSLTALASDQSLLPQMTIIGIITDSQSQIALVKEQGASSATGLTIGTMIGEWQVMKITTDSVTLRAGLQEQTIKMVDKNPSETEQITSHLPANGLPVESSSPSASGRNPPTNNSSLQNSTSPP